MICACPNRRVCGVRVFWTHRIAIWAMHLSKELTMNKDQVNGALKDLGGKIQEEAGKLTGSTEQQAKGLANQVEGKTQEKVGDAKEVIKDALN